MGNMEITFSRSESGNVERVLIGYQGNAVSFMPHLQSLYHTLNDISIRVAISNKRRNPTNPLFVMRRHITGNYPKSRFTIFHVKFKSSSSQSAANDSRLCQGRERCFVRHLSMLPFITISRRQLIQDSCKAAWQQEMNAICRALSKKRAFR